MRRSMLILIILCISLYALTVSPFPLTKTATVTDPKGLTATAIQLPNGCVIFKDPDPQVMDNNWSCIYKQRNSYLEAKDREDYEEMVFYAPWSSQEAWAWFNWAKKILRGQRASNISNETLLKAKEYCDNSLRCCERAMLANISTREAKRCIKEEKKLRLYISRCLGTAPWPEKAKKTKKGGKK